MYTRRVKTLLGQVLALLLLVGVFSAPASAGAATARIPELPFDIPSRADLAASGHDVVAYYHTLTPYDGSNSANTYGANISPTGNGGANISSGGKWRQRPAPVVDSTNLTNAKRVQYMYDDISTAANIGVDAFFVNMIDLPSESTRWANLNTPLYDAADQYSANNTPGFKVATDMSALAITHESTTNQAATKWADAIAPMVKRPSAYKYAGRPAVAVYQVDLLSASWYSSFAARVKADTGLDIYILPSYQGNSPSTDLQPYTGLMPSLMPIVHGWTGTGYTTPVNQVQSTLRSWAASHNVKFMGSVGPFENDRPSLFKEIDGHGFGILQTMWKAAIQNKDPMVQIVSWSDYEEEHNVRPSTAYQFAPYDVTAYYLTSFKQGTPPPITRDVIYYAHRMQLLNAPYNHTKQSQAYSFLSAGSSPPVDDIVTLAFLTAPANVQVWSGGTLRTHAAVPAGVTQLTDPLSVAAAPAWAVVRPDGTTVIPKFTSPFVPRSSVVWQDLVYRMGSSSRPVIANAQTNLPENR